MYQIILVDDDKAFLSQLTLDFNWRQFGFEVAASVSNSTEALKTIEFICPDLVITDIVMSGINGIELIKQAKKIFPQMQFAVISQHADFEYAQQLIENGALAYCLKPIDNLKLESLLTKAKEILDAKRMVTQSAFMKMLKSHSNEDVQNFLNSIPFGIHEKKSLYIAVSWGEISDLLIGNVCFSPVRISERCNIYLISSNGEYLQSLAFQHSLINAASKKKLTSFTFCHTDNPSMFFSEKLDSFLNNSLYHFMNPENTCFNTYDISHVHMSEDMWNKLTSAAYNNRCLDMLSNLGAIKKPYLLDIDDALKIYNLCDALLSRIDNDYILHPITHGFELAEEFSSFEKMLDYLSYRLNKAQKDVIPDTVKNKTLREVLEYININFTEQISFRDICTKYCINPSYLSQLFKRETGITFTSYLAKLRIGLAKELLSTTNLRVSEISERIGYDYYFNFTKLFKKETGFTPKQYREQASKIN